jgi:uncharacterized OB-fold protein
LPPEVLHVSVRGPDGRLFTQLCDACRTPEALPRLGRDDGTATPCESCGKALTPEELIDSIGANLCWACRTADPDQYEERPTEGDAVEQHERVKLRVGERITVKRDGTEESGVVQTVQRSHYTIQTDDGRMLRYELRFKQRRAKLALGTRCTLCGRVLSPDEELDLTFLGGRAQAPRDGSCHQAGAAARRRVDQLDA